MIVSFVEEAVSIIALFHQYLIILFHFEKLTFLFLHFLLPHVLIAVEQMNILIDNSIELFNRLQGAGEQMTGVIGRSVRDDRSIGHDNVENMLHFVREYFRLLIDGQHLVVQGGFDLS